MATKPTQKKAPVKKAAPKAAQATAPELVVLPAILSAGTHRVKGKDDTLLVHVPERCCVDGKAMVKLGKLRPDWAGGTDKQWTPASLVRDGKQWVLMRSHRAGVMTAYRYHGADWEVITGS